jgi:hypothetical protein
MKRIESDNLIEKVKNEIVQKTNPASIFTYGSYNGPDFIPGTSDIEIGVIKRKRGSISKVLRGIAEKYSKKDLYFRIYPYYLRDLKSLKIDNPWTKSAFVRRLILTSKTIWGKKTIENLRLPSVDLIDAYREACATTERAMTGLYFLRVNKEKEAGEMGYKACLYATLSLEYLLGIFPVGFKNIVEDSKRLKLDKEWRNLISFSYDLRRGKMRPKKKELYDFIFQTITYCNKIAEEKTRNELKKGNRILIK